MIVVAHSRGLFGFRNDYHGMFGVLVQGVSFFFVLSGFILTYVYPRLDDWPSRKHFLCARFARIWPAHMTAFFLFLFLLPRALWVLPGVNAKLVALTHVLMIHSWFGQQKYFFAFDAPSWSIATEFFFYLMFPLLIRGWGRNWWAKLGGSCLVLIALVAICNSAGVAYNTGSTTGTSIEGLIYIHPLPHLFEFTLGMTAALAWGKSSLRVACGRGVGTLVELAAVLAVVLGLFCISRLYHDPMHPSYWKAGEVWLGRAGTLWLSHSGAAPLFALLIFCFAHEKGLISRMLSAPFPVLLGEISYSVYLVHWVFLRYYQVSLSCTSWHWVTGPFAYVIFWLVLLLTCHVIFVSIETPSRRFLRQLVAGKNPDQTSLKPGGNARFLNGYRWWLFEYIILFMIALSIWFLAHSHPCQ
jgi:peptidoglycan/LPS O-acetylase OafA/YrhL